MDGQRALHRHIGIFLLNARMARRDLGKAGLIPYIGSAYRSQDEGEVKMQAWEGRTFGGRRARAPLPHAIS